MWAFASKLEVLENDHHLVLEPGRTIKHENKAQKGSKSANTFWLISVLESEQKKKKKSDAIYFEKLCSIITQQFTTSNS